MIKSITNRNCSYNRLTNDFLNFSGCFHLFFDILDSTSHTKNNVPHCNENGILDLKHEGDAGNTSSHSGYV